MRTNYDTIVGSALVALTVIVFFLLIASTMPGCTSTPDKPDLMPVKMCPECPECQEQIDPLTGCFMFLISPEMFECLNDESCPYREDLMVHVDGIVNALRDMSFYETAYTNAINEWKYEQAVDAGSLDH